MKNNYEVRGDVVVIFLDSPKYGKMETIISPNKLALLHFVDFKFYPSWDKVTKTFRVMYHPTLKTTGTLHRLLCGNPYKMVVDHWNKDTLDNTDENLKVVPNSKNLQNRGIHTTNKTGLKGVSYNPTSHSIKKYLSQVWIDGKHKFLGRFHTAEEAHQVYMDFIKQNSHFNLEANKL